jgi:excisionase family DNA binding protein
MVDIQTLADARRSPLATLTLVEAARLMRVDPRTVSAAAQAGEIPSVKVGRRQLIPREAFLDFLDGKRGAAL